MTEQQSNDDCDTLNLRRRGAWIAIGLFTAIGLSLRLAGTFNDLWLDEIWSIGLASQANSAWDVISTIRHDNNHWLNTLWLYSTLGWEAPMALRLPAVVFGTASIVLMALLASGRGMIDAVFAAMLGALCYPLIHYSSEARGYAGAMFLSLLSVWLAGKYLKTAWRGWAVLFWLSCVLGWLSHLTFLFVYLGILIWTGYRIASRKQRLSVKAGTMLLLHGIPALFFAMFYVNIVRDFTIGGGEPRGLGQVVVEFLTLPFGVAIHGTKGVVMSIKIALLLAVLSFLRLRRSGDQLYVLYVLTILISVLLTFWRPIDHLHIRYFLVCIPFLLLLVSHALASLTEWKQGGRAIAFALVALFVIGNAHQTVRFFKYGRGQYVKAIDDLFSLESSPEIHITSDHDFRNRMVLQYHAHVLGGRKRIVYFPLRDGARANWLLVHRFDPDAPNPSTIEVDEGIEFERVATYPHGGLSGWTWVLFARSRP